MIHNILNELNENNGSNYKIGVLKKHQNNKLLQRVLQMTHDKVKFTFGLKKIPDYTWNNNTTICNSLEETLDLIEQELVTRNKTGNAAINYLASLLIGIDSKENAEIIEKIIDRDLKINMGRSNINKVFKNLIVKPPYMRCGVYGKKTAKKINFPAILQLKADGRFVSIIIDNSKVTFISRSGEESKFPILEKRFVNFPDGVYIGELLVRGITDRRKANGLINSSEPPHDDIYVQLWDYITLAEYANAKGKNVIEYKDRLHSLISNVEADSFVTIIETHKVNNIREALQITSDLMNKGYEGSILKDLKNIFKDHTSPTQLKLKLEIDLDVRIVGFTEGTPGTKREKTFGAMVFETDDGKIKGQTSGFNDKQLEAFNSIRNELIGKIIVVKFNDLSKAKGNDYYALSHPRFIEIRTDKEETDTLERAFELREMAMELKEKE